MWSAEQPHEREKLARGGIKDAVSFLADIIRRESASVPLSHNVLGGVYQGCAVALHALLHLAEQIVAS